MTNKPSKSIAKATGSVSFSTFSSRILGLIRDMLIAANFGAGNSTDAFFVAFKIPNLLRRLVAEGALSSIFVPIFTTELHKSKNNSIKALQSTFGFTIILTVSLSILGICFANQLTELFAPGFSSDPQKFELTAFLTKIMFPYIVLVSLLAVASGALNVLGFYALPAFAPAILNIFFIISIVLFKEKGVICLAWAVLIGGLAALLVQLRLLKKEGYKIKPSSPFKSEPVKQLCSLMCPAILSASVYQLMVFINTLLASYLIAGSVSWLYYADRLFQFPLGIFSIAIATALLPKLSLLLAEKKQSELKSTLITALNWLSFITIPASFGLIVLSEPLVKSIYDHGNFTSSSALQTSVCLSAFAIGLWPASMQTILTRAFLAAKNTKIPAIVSIISLTVNLTLALSLMGTINGSDTSFFTSSLQLFQSKLPNFSLSHQGLALASSGTSFFSMACLAYLLKKIDLRFHLNLQISCIIKSLISSLIMAFVLIKLQTVIKGPYLQTSLGVLTGIFVYGASSLVLKNSLAVDTLKIANKFLKKRTA